MKITVKTEFPNPPMYALELEERRKREDKKLIQEYYDGLLYSITEKGLEFLRNQTL